jgi:hypothetical protein
MKDKPELVPFNEVFMNKFSYNTFKNGNFYTKCVFENVEALKKPVVLIFSNFDTLMQLYNPKMKTYKGLIFTTKELEDIAVGDNYSLILKILKLEFKCITIENNDKYIRTMVNTGIVPGYITCAEIDELNKKLNEQYYGTTQKDTKKKK